MIDLRLGDCLDVLKTLPDGCVDAVVTDPPAGIAFMGKEWDAFGGRANPDAENDRNAANRGPGAGLGNQPFGYSGSAIDPKTRRAFIDFLTPRLAECLRVAKPGARMLCWAIPRTSHWTGTAIEDAGWIIEDRVAHLFGQGFPKAKSKLKPAVEDWWLARKPGGKVPPLQIDACRIGVDTIRSRKNGGFGDNFRDDNWEPPAYSAYGAHQGRWPANVALSHHPDCREVGVKRVKSGTAVNHNRPPGIPNQVYGKGWDHSGRDEGYAGPDGRETVEAWRCVEGCPVAELDAQSGTLKTGGWSGHRNRPKTQDVYGQFDLNDECPRPGDSGGASRFFYCSKASRRDRGEGNDHPTVKNSKLMRWLCRLIARPGDVILDSFMGTGSTGAAAIAEGFGFIGIERDPHYFALADRRLAEARSALPLLAAQD